MIETWEIWRTGALPLVMDWGREAHWALLSTLVLNLPMALRFCDFLFSARVLYLIALYWGPGLASIFLVSQRASKLLAITHFCFVSVYKYVKAKLGGRIISNHKYELEFLSLSLSLSLCVSQTHTHTRTHNMFCECPYIRGLQMCSIWLDFVAAFITSLPIYLVVFVTVLFYGKMWKATYCKCCLSSFEP